MRYSFIFGPSGSGKTDMAFREMIEASLRFPEKRFFILVPEQHGVLMQKKLLQLHPRRASGNVEVMSLHRMAFRVLGELNIRHPKLMDDSGKAMVLRRVATERSGALGVWRERMKQAGFAEQVKSLVSECMQYGVRPEDLTRAGEGVRLPLRQKLGDLASLYEGFAEFCAERSLPEEELLQLFSEHVPESGLLRGAALLFDGFTGFTPVQYRLIARMMRAAESVRFTATLGRGEDPYRRRAEDELFCVSGEMSAKISGLAAENGVPHGEDLFLEETPRFRAGGALSFLEEHFLRYDGARFSGETNELRLILPSGPAEEASRAAEEILRLVRTKGCRWREIAVVSADFDGSAALLQNEFRRQGIPCHVDRKLNIAYNPLSELLRSALGCAADYFSGRSFLRFLKCGLVSEERGMIALCSSYMTLCGIRSFQKLASDWEFVPRELAGIDAAALNRFKNEALELLMPLGKIFEGKRARVGEAAACLRTLMERCGAREKLEKLREGFAGAHDAEREREFADVFEETERILGEMEELLGEELLNREDMAGVLDAGLREVRVGQIPAFADQVTIADLRRSRLSDIRFLFLLGANDGKLPLKRQEGGLLNDREREALRANGIFLAPTAREELCAQRYDLYRTLTQPSEGLYVFAPATDREGKSQRPSGIVNQLKRLFPGLREEGNSEKKEYFSEIQARRELISELRELRKRGAASAPSSSLALLLPAYCAERSRREEALRLIDASCFFYRPEGIGRELALSLYGEKIEGSVTRIEQFFRCPCSHFYQYGLGLSEFKEFEVRSRDIGTLTHRAIELVFREAGRLGKGIEEMEGPEREDFVARCVEEALRDEESGLYLDSARNGWLAGRLRELVQRSVRVMAERLGRGDYRPAAAEFSFSADRVSALRLPLSGGGELRLRGKADRVDLCESSGSIYVKIVDYKTGSTTWEPYRMLSGSQLQLILYLDAVTELLEKERRGAEIVPGAVFYLRVDDPFLKREEAGTEDEVFRKTLKALRPSGLMNADEAALLHLSRDLERAGDFLPLQMRKGELKTGEQAVSAGRFSLLRSYVRRKAREAGEAMLRGDAAAYPLREGGRDACAFCPYGQVCGFDLKSGGYAFRNNPKLGAVEVWAEIDRQLAACLPGAGGGTSGKADESGREADESGREADESSPEADETAREAHGTARGAGERTEEKRAPGGAGKERPE